MEFSTDFVKCFKQEDKVAPSVSSLLQEVGRNFLTNKCYFTKFFYSFSDSIVLIGVEYESNGDGQLMSMKSVTLKVPRFSKVF